MRRRIAALLVLLLLGAAGSRAEPRTVILISLDGVRHDYPERGELPALERMRRDGARAERLIPVFPSSTFPTHVSLATGTYPDRHGILGNRFRDRERGAFDYSDDAEWIEAEPLWIAAERQGRIAAVFFWVGSATDWRGARARYRVEPFDSSVGERQKVEQIVAWIDLPEARRPQLIMSWWHGADRDGHRKGPEHPDVFGALAEQDRHLEALLRALDARDAWDHTTLLVVSDHGMTAVSEAISVRSALDQAGVAARLESSSSVAHVFLEDPDALPRAERALADLPGTELHLRDTVPTELRISHPRRVGDLVLLTDPPHTFRESSLAARALGSVTRSLGLHQGAHGYRPEHPDMAGIFFALGRGVPAGGRLGSVRMIDVAPSVARLLAIDPPRDSEGRPIPGLGD